MYSTINSLYHANGTNLVLKMIERGKNEALIEKVASKRKTGMTKYWAEMIVIAVEGNLKTGSSKCDFSLDGSWDIKKEKLIINRT